MVPIRFCGGAPPVVRLNWYCSASVPRMPMSASPENSESRRNANSESDPSWPVNSPGAR